MTVAFTTGGVMYPQGLSAMESSRAIVNEPPCGGRKTQVRQEIDILAREVDRAFDLSQKLQPLIPQVPVAGNGQGHDGAKSTLAPLAQEIAGLTEKVMALVGLLERVEL